MTSPKDFLDPNLLSVVQPSQNEDGFMGRTKAQIRNAFRLDVARRALESAVVYRDECGHRLRRAEDAVRGIEAEIETLTRDEGSTSTKTSENLPYQKSLTKDGLT